MGWMCSLEPGHFLYAPESPRWAVPPGVMRSNNTVSAVRLGTAVRCARDQANDWGVVDAPGAPGAHHSALSRAACGSGKPRRIF